MTSKSYSRCAKFVLHILESRQKALQFIIIELVCVARCVILQFSKVGVSLLQQSVIQIASIGTNLIEIPYVLGSGHFLPVDEAFVFFLTMTRTNDADVAVAVEHFDEDAGELAYG